MKDAQTLIVDIAREAGELVLTRFKQDRESYRKSANPLDVVTEADLASERLIVSRIQDAFPDHGIISEELGKMNEGAEFVWIIDPIDGTLNFAHGIPLFAVMIALAHRGEVELAAVNLPALGEFYFAKAGSGAFCNGHKISCATTADLDTSAGITSSGMRLRTVGFLRKLLDFVETRHTVLTLFGCIGVNAAYVASGKRDWLVQPTAAMHDFAANALILKEAGCVVTDMNGDPWKLGINEMVAANPLLHPKLLELTRGL